MPDITESDRLILATEDAELATWGDVIWDLLNTVVGWNQHLPEGAPKFEISECFFNPEVNRISFSRAYHMDPGETQTRAQTQKGREAKG